MSSKLYFRYGAMNSGKTTLLLQVAYNYEERDQKVLIMKPAVDTKGDDNIISRLGVKRQVDLLITPEMDVLATVRGTLATKPVDCILIDEAQFLTRDQVNDLFTTAVTLNVPVMAYGIRTDFKTDAFPGSRRLLEIAHSVEEMKTICRCGRKAILNGLKIDGRFVRYDERQVIIDDGSVEYEALCGVDYLAKVGPLP